MIVRIQVVQKNHQGNMDAFLFHVDQRFIGWWREGPPAFLLRIQLLHTHGRSRGQSTRLCSGSVREYNSKTEG